MMENLNIANTENSYGDWSKLHDAERTLEEHYVDMGVRLAFTEDGYQIPLHESGWRCSEFYRRAEWWGCTKKRTANQRSENILAIRVVRKSESGKTLYVQFKYNHHYEKDNWSENEFVTDMEALRLHIWRCETRKLEEYAKIKVRKKLTDSRTDVIKWDNTYYM